MTPLESFKRRLKYRSVVRTVYLKSKSMHPNNLDARPNHEFSSFEKKYRRQLNVSHQPIRQFLVFGKIFIKVLSW
jgi:hypothetical protein